MAFVARSQLVGSAIRTAASSRNRINTRTMATSDKVEMIKSTVSSNKVVVFSKTYCPYCTRVKSLFAQLKVDANVLELDEISDGAAIQDSLQTVTGRRTVPQVFVGSQFVGGCDDTMAAHQAGKLVPMLQSAGVTVSA